MEKVDVNKIAYTQPMHVAKCTIVITAYIITYHSLKSFGLEIMGE